jgi:hypothetical protein
MRQNYQQLQTPLPFAVRAGDDYDADFLQSADISMIEPERKRIQLNGEAEESGSEIHEVFGIDRWSAGFVFETWLFFRR